MFGSKTVAVCANLHYRTFRGPRVVRDFLSRVWWLRHNRCDSEV